MACSQKGKQKRYSDRYHVHMQYCMQHLVTFGRYSCGRCDHTRCQPIKSHLFSPRIDTFAPCYYARILIRQANLISAKAVKLCVIYSKVAYDVNTQPKTGKFTSFDRLVINKSISGCVCMTCNSLLTLSLLQVVNFCCTLIVKTCYQQTCCKLFQQTVANMQMNCNQPVKLITCKYKSVAFLTVKG